MNREPLWIHPNHQHLYDAQPVQDHYGHHRAVTPAGPGMNPPPEARPYVVPHGNTNHVILPYRGNQQVQKEEGTGHIYYKVPQGANLLNHSEAKNHIPRPALQEYENHMKDARQRASTGHVLFVAGQGFGHFRPMASAALLMLSTNRHSCITLLFDRDFDKSEEYRAQRLLAINATPEQMHRIRVHSFEKRGAQQEWLARALLPLVQHQDVRFQGVVHDSALALNPNIFRAAFKNVFPQESFPDSHFAELVTTCALARLWSKHRASLPKDEFGDQDPAMILKSLEYPGLKDSLSKKWAGLVDKKQHQLTLITTTKVLEQQALHALQEREKGRTTLLPIGLVKSLAERQPLPTQVQSFMSGGTFWLVSFGSKRDTPPSDEYIITICEALKGHNIRFLLLHPAISPRSRLHGYFNTPDARRLLWTSFVNTSELFASSSLTHAILAGGWSTATEALLSKKRVLYCPQSLEQECTATALNHIIGNQGAHVLTHLVDMDFLDQRGGHDPVLQTFRKDLDAAVNAMKQSGPNLPGEYGRLLAELQSRADDHKGGDLKRFQQICQYFSIPK